jgi:hypothetical protein
MPPGRPTLHVEGDVTLPTPGFETKLVAATPPGTDAKELVLELVVTPRPGNWIQVVTHVHPTFTIEGYEGAHERVLVRLPDGTAVKLTLDQVF